MIEDVIPGRGRMRASGEVLLSHSFCKLPATEVRINNTTNLFYKISSTTAQRLLRNCFSNIHLLTMAQHYALGNTR